MILMSTEIREQNRRSWNAVVPIHAAHRRNDAALLRSGGSTLFADERALLGEPAGRRLLHLCCNSGRDTLSLAAEGALVTGVDLSDTAIAHAAALRDDVGLAAEFICADVLDYLAGAPPAGFDIVYAAYGVICWISDLQALFGGIQRVLKPGGRFVLIEFHPTSNLFDHEWRLAHDYPSGGAAMPLAGVGDYVGAAGGALSAGTVAADTPFVNPEPCVLFRWGVGDVVTAAAAAGLLIEQLREYCYVNGERPFARMTADAAQRMYPPADIPAVPLMYGLTARRGGGESNDADRP
jgi:SAM-dependent methyltransferase